MARAHVQHELPASAEKVWSLIQDFADMTAWANPDMSISRSEGSGKGAVRWVETAQGQMVERCETYDPASRSFSYSVTDGPEALTHYLATVTLRPDAEDAERRCIITWPCDFELKGMEEDDAVRMLEGVFRDGFIANLTKSLVAS